MDKNTYTDIYNGFVERDETENRHLSQTVKTSKKITTKKELTQETSKKTKTYTDIYGGYVDVEEQTK